MNPDPNQPITPPIPPVESEVTPPTPPPAPTPVDIPQTTPTPPPPPPPGITTDAKVKWGAGKVVGAIAVVVILVVGLAAGIFLSQRQQNVKITEASGPSRLDSKSGPECDGGSGGASCVAPNGGSVYKFVCGGDLHGGQCGNIPGGGAGPEAEFHSNSSLDTSASCDKTVQLDVFPMADCRVNGNWECGVPSSHVIFYTGECQSIPTVTPIPTTPPTSNDPSGFVNVSCGPNGQMQIRGSATDPDVPETALQLHFYFDSDPSDNNAAVLTDTVTATNGRFSRNLPNSVARYAGTGPAVVLNDNQNHVVKAYAINAPGTSGANNELDNSPVTFTFAGCALPTATPTPGPSATPTVTPTPPPGSASCQQVTIVKIMHNGSEVANPSLAKIQKGDVVTFRGFATATNTSVTHINFVLTKSGTAQAPVSVVPTLVSGTYQADFAFTADIATTYSVSSSPVYQQ